MSELALTSSDCLLKCFLCCSQSKTKRKAIICAPPQGGHLTGNNYEVWCSTVFPTEDFFFTFTWALKPFNYCHLIIITSNVSVAGDWQCLGRCGFQRASGFNHHQIELCVWVIKLVPNRVGDSRQFWLSPAGHSIPASFDTELNAAPLLNVSRTSKDLDYFCFPQADHNGGLAKPAWPRGFGLKPLNEYRDHNLCLYMKSCCLSPPTCMKDSTQTDAWRAF